ncbi:hypothetical protein ASPZODRAFT_147596 [Penicilliopsis zonata CBS 506.65]|uniref:DUF3669 domain-containing protein n=1 Tax=Penicilliopsis zonata CBS 506.65 TaxID=1073090 RepID=A0A1L9S572_9EURO|nr:hypothetical protein ASPZODRAFT_147596 [Penicilliopsis zonata CBS 506.65]OJJ42292.1 hypothetical protein ASPZODRAFT_147596 [Penicilliopsis zonata CBS 506.65]
MADFHNIGRGFCGTVWSTASPGPAFKREDGGPQRSLANDFTMHKRLLEAFVTAKQNGIHIRVKIPQCDTFITPDQHDWWRENLPRFPEGYTPCNMIQAQRIPPFKEPTRRLLVEKFCPDEIQKEIVSSRPNEACLVRAYLGRRRTQTTRRLLRTFSLRNYPLHLDQMEELQIPSTDIQEYALIMAQTLAIIHWVGEVDGNDIEFVLAPPAKDSEEDEGRDTRSNDDTIISNILGEHCMWILDFDVCRSMSMDEKGVHQAVTAFSRNDPFFPRPQKEPSLWHTFREEYLQTSERLLSSQELYLLPKLFITLIEESESRPL